MIGSNTSHKKDLLASCDVFVASRLWLHNVVGEGTHEMKMSWHILRHYGSNGVVSDL